MMQFNFTPEEAQPAAEAIAKYLQRKKRMSISVEVPAWPDAGWRTTLIGKQGNLIVLVEVQGTLNYTKPLKDFASWIAARRHYAELNIAINSEATMQARVSEELKNDGVGLLIVDEDGSVSESIKPKNPAFVITPDPTLRYGRCKHEVINTITKFNNVDRKDGLRDMCELVERETATLAVLAVRRGLLKRDEATVLRIDWASQINILASRDDSVLTPPPIFDDKLKDDMISFKGARNLIDHKVQNKREDRERQLQFAERMMQGPRLIAKLVSLQRKVK